MRSICVAAAMMGLIAAPAAAAPKAVEVMVMGSYHFANHNRDLRNVHSDDVLDARRQRELSALAVRLAVWKPTKIMVEVIPPKTGQRLTGPKAEFDHSLLSTSREEWAQIGYGLAAIVRAPVFTIN